MHFQLKKPASIFLTLILALALIHPVYADHLVSVPAGTIVPLKMDTYLSSDSSTTGERFTATVTRDVFVDAVLAIPVNAKVEGHVTGATRAERSSRAGSIAVAFDRIVLTNGASIPVDATLTTLSEEGRRQIDRDVIDEEDRVAGGNRTRRAVVFIGGGAGAGAVIGAIAGGGKGAAVGAGLGAVLGTIGVLVGKGEKAEVQPGTEFGMRIERSFTINSENTETLGNRYDNQQADLNSSDAIREAQIALRDKGFYRGPINGEMNFETRGAIRNYQRDRNLAVTGELDFRTARELGLRGDGPVNPGPIGPGPVGSGAGIGNARQIAFLANRLAQDYKRDLNIRENRGQVIFDARRNFTENEVELLFQMDALQSAAQLYGQIATNITDPAALKGAADSLIRQMRLASRAMRRNTSIRLSTIVMNDWEQLRSELRNITVTDNNLDSDVIR